jgi:hypothetical protein
MQPPPQAQDADLEIDHMKKRFVIRIVCIATLVQAESNTHRFACHTRTATMSRNMGNVVS